MASLLSSAQCKTQCNKNVMAIVILFGLGSSTILNMFVVPALMLRFGSAR
jgi:multidrug efflux pump subunit AcrB